MTDPSQDREESGGSDRFAIDPASVAAYRAELLRMAEGVPIAEAAIEGYSDSQVVEAMERMWAAGVEPENDTSSSISTARSTTQDASDQQ